MLERIEGVKPTILRARTLIRLDEAKSAFDLLGGVRLESLSHGEAAEVLAVRVFAAISLGEVELAEELLTDARARSYGVGSAQLASEIHYYAALLLWSQGRLDEASVGAQMCLTSESEVPAWLRDDEPATPFVREYWQARSFELLGMTAGLKGDYEAQASFLMKAFETYDVVGSTDTYFEASLLYNLSILVRDLQMSTVLQFVRDRYERIRWSESLRSFEYGVLSAFGWSDAVGGDHLGGLRNFRKSAECAPTVPLRISAILDRAFLASELGEIFSSLEDLDHAAQLVSAVDWSRCRSEDRTVLLDLARATAKHDSSQARRLLDQYSAIRSPISPLMLLSRDRRRRGDECMASAAVARAEHQLDRATMLFKEAFEIWTEVGYAWRAATAALEVYTLTGEAKYLDVVAREAATRPHSWIARRYAAVVLDDPKTYVRV